MKPHEFTSIAPGIALGYRRCRGPGRWVVRVTDGHRGNWTKVVGLADDQEEADGERVLTWWQASDKARELARGSDADAGRPVTVADAVDPMHVIWRLAGPPPQTQSRFAGAFPQPWRQSRSGC